MMEANQWNISTVGAGPGREGTCRGPPAAPFWSPRTEFRPLPSRTPLTSSTEVWSELHMASALPPLSLACFRVHRNPHRQPLAQPPTTTKVGLVCSPWSRHAERKLHAWRL